MRTIAVSVTAALLWMGWTGPLRAQEAGEGAAASIGPALADLVAKRKALEGNNELDEATRTRLVALYKEAEGFAVAAEESRKKGVAFRNSIEEAPKNTANLTARLAEIQVPKDPRELVPRSERVMEIEVLQVLFTTEESSLKKAKDLLTEITDAVSEADQRPGEIATESAGAQERKAKAETAIAALRDKTERTADEEAELAHAESRLEAARAGLDTLEQERLGAPGRRAMLTARRKVREVEARRLELRVEELRKLKNAGLRDKATDAERVAEEARLTGDDEGGVADEISKYSKELKGVAGRIAASQRAIDDLDKESELLSTEFEFVKQRLEASGGRGASSQVLLDQQRTMPSAGEMKRALRSRQDETVEARLARITVDAELRKLKAETPAGKEPGTELKDTRREILEELSTQYGTLIWNLATLESNERVHLQTVENFKTFLRENLFWVPSSPRAGLATLTGLPSGLNWLFGPERWDELARALGNAVKRAPVRVGLLAVVAVLLLLLRRRLRRRMAAFGPKIRRVSADQYFFTLEALGIVIAISAPFSLLLWTVGFELFYEPDASDWLRGVSQGLIGIAPLLFTFVFVREMSRKDGLAQVHFRWTAPVLQRMFRQVTGMAIGYVPAMLVAAVFMADPSNEHVHSVGRLAVIFAMLWAAWWLARLLRPSDGILSGFTSRNPEGGVQRLRYLWYPAMILLPVILAVLAVFGYLITAVELSWRMEITVVIAIGAVLLYELLLRWFRIRERKLALEQMLAERKARREAAVADGVAEVEQTVIDPEEAAMDLDLVGAQTRRLLRAVVLAVMAAAVWFAWADTLPVLRSLDQHTLVGHASIADILLFLLILVATTVVAKNLPGILEIAILRRLPIDSGVRYAIATLAQYVIVAFGVIGAFQALALDWSQFGWILAALSVGLGFGLQEIVANFVCGIILLFERPIRVGDVVTVSNVTGVISRIRIRATTITDWDRKEFVVPNKEFITGQVLNWTLSNTTNRIVIKIGVAYGSNTQEVSRLVLGILENHPALLQDPAPSVTFENFGDSSLDFVVRCYLPSLDRRLSVRHDLYTTINDRLKEAGIEIPFPQRDLHIRGGLEGLKGG